MTECQLPQVSCHNLTVLTIIMYNEDIVKGSLLWPRATQWRIYYHWMWGQLSTTWSNANVVAQWAAPSCSQLQSAMDNGIRDSRSIWLAIGPLVPLPLPITGQQYPLSSTCMVQMWVTNHKTCRIQWNSNIRPSECQANALPLRLLMVLVDIGIWGWRNVSLWAPLYYFIAIMHLFS